MDRTSSICFPLTHSVAAITKLTFSNYQFPTTIIMPKHTTIHQTTQHTIKF
ncbi:hypothetical protein HanIR_Chr09g0442591 [Helianthus annuus]|nr:hypothetical protein HanIR_Chr09g0442591 [Helianthus annuus]